MEKEKAGAGRRNFVYVGIIIPLNPPSKGDFINPSEN
jgi:hypothetical protein